MPSRGRTTLATAAVALVVLAAPPPAPSHADGDDGYERVVDLTFPVSGPVTFIDDYHQPRGGGSRRHQATDLMADKLQQVHAAVDGEICFITGLGEPEPSWGYQLILCGDDDLQYAYIHLNNDTPGTDDGEGGPGWAYAPGIRRGVQVERGQWIGFVGDSGNAEDTPPHLHFEIRDPELDDPALDDPPYQQGRLNPFPSLEAARARGDVPQPSTTPDQVPALRLAGPERVGTAVAVSQHSHPQGAPRVVVAPAAEPAQALAAAPLAAALSAPMLLTYPAELADLTATEIARLGAGEVVLVGDRAQIEDAVEQDALTLGVEVVRIGGADRWEVSAAVAEEIARVAGPPEQVFLALGSHEHPGRSWPDALSVSALASHLRVPVLLTGGEQLPRATAAALTALDPDEVVVVGGTAAISEDVAQDAAGHAEASHRRLSGAERYATSVAVAHEQRLAGLDAAEVWVVTGRNYPDALTAGPAAARAGAPLVLVDGALPIGSSPTDLWLREQAGSVTRALAVGGGAAVGERSLTAVRRLLAG